MIEVCQVHLLLILIRVSFFSCVIHSDIEHFKSMELVQADEDLEQVHASNYVHQLEAG